MSSHGTALRRWTFAGIALAAIAFVVAVWATSRPEAPSQPPDEGWVRRGDRELRFYAHIDGHPLEAWEWTGVGLGCSEAPAVHQFESVPSGLLRRILNSPARCAFRARESGADAVRTSGTWIRVVRIGSGEE